jgi:hypothetical protein
MIFILSTSMLFRKHARSLAGLATISFALMGCHDAATAVSANPPTPNPLEGKYIATPVVLDTGSMSIWMNDRGEIGAMVNTTTGRRVLRWSNGRLDTLRASVFVNVAGIDNLGDVIGSTGPEIDSIIPVRWTAGSVTAEPILPFFTSMNGYGLAVSKGGTIAIGVAGSKYYLLHGTSMDTLALSPALDGLIELVDDAGDIAAEVASGTPYPPTLIHYADGRERVFSSGRGSVFVGTMNNHGVAIGSAEVSPRPTFAPVLLDSSRFVFLDSIYGSGLGVTDINDDGWILGSRTVTSASSSSTAAPTLFIGKAVISVQSLLADQSLQVLRVYALNNAGQILAKARDTAGVERFVMLTPS